MDNSLHTQSSTAETQWRTWMADMRYKAIWLGITVLYVGGLVLSGSSSLFRDSTQYLVLALLAFAIAGFALLMKQWHPLLAASGAVIGSLIIILLAILWGELVSVMVLLTVSVGLAMLAISFRVGLVIAVGCSLLLLIGPAILLQSPFVLRAATVASIWGVCALIWLMTDSLLMVARWAWLSYEEGRRALEQVREQQVKLCETMEDLAAANAQWACVEKVDTEIRFRSSHDTQDLHARNQRASRSVELHQRQTSRPNSI